MITDTVEEKERYAYPLFNSADNFIVTAVNYADRATLSIAGTEVAKELQLSAVSMGYIFSAFGWAYLLMQIPGGWLLDKFGSKKFIHTACSSGRCSPSCKASWICSRWPGGVSMFLCALCWVSRKRLRSRQTPVSSRHGSRPKNVEPRRQSLTQPSIFHWLCSHRCLVG